MPPSSGRITKPSKKKGMPTALIAPSAPSIPWVPNPRLTCKSTSVWSSLSPEVKGESNGAIPQFSGEWLMHAWKWGSDWGRSVHFIFTPAQTPNGVHAIPAQAAPRLDTAIPRSPQRWQTERDGTARVAAHKVGRSEQSGRREDQLSICLSSGNDGVPQR